MADLSTISDDQLDAMINAQQSAANNSSISSAILGQESNDNPDAPTSTDGAVGMGQIEPATFAQYAKPGEDINNPDDNLAVHNRIIADLSNKANGDPARIAVGYFSGPGNIAPPDSPTPWKSDRKDGNGKQVSSYVSDVMKRMSPVQNANASVPADEESPSPQPTGITALSDDDLDAQIAKLQGKNTPSLLDSAIQPIENIHTIQNKEANEGVNAMTQPLPSPTGNIGHDLVQGLEDPFKRIGGAMQFGMSYPTAAIDALVAQPAKNTAISAGMSPKAAHNYIENPINTIGSLAIPAGVEKVAPDVLKAGESIIDRLKNSAFINDESSMGGPISNASKAAAANLAPSIDPRTAQVVKDAQDLGINIPTRVFNPGSTSGALNKVGLMADDNMKSEMTTALSKTMGHEGTPNLDVNTMNGIQNTIGGKMNNFALQADAGGGIPVSKDDLAGIAEDSLADAPKVNKLITKVQDRIGENGTISGSDYQALTKKGSVIDRAMNSSDTELSDTASEIRSHLDNQLEKSVSPDDLAAFKEARRQYRTLKIVQPLVESGGVTGQADSATKLFNAVNRNYGSMQNALKYNPDLGKIAQIANEFPEALKDVPKVSARMKLAKAATAPAAIGIGAVGGVPAGVTAAAALPVAKGVGSYLSSPFYKNAILDKSLPTMPSAILPSIEEQIPGIAEQKLLPSPQRPNIVDWKGNVRPVTDEEWQSSIDRNKASSDIGLTPDVRNAQFKNANAATFQSAADQRQQLIDTQLDKMWKENQPSLKDVVKTARNSKQDLSEAIGKKPKSTYLGSALDEAFDKEGYAKGGMVKKRKAILHTKHLVALKDKLGREPKETEIELAHYVGPHGVKRLLAQKDDAMPAHKMFPAETVKKHRDLFYDKKKAHSVSDIKSVL